MNTYEVIIEQVNRYRVTITAPDDETAQEIFDEYLVEDFGEPVSSGLTYEIVETPHTRCDHDYESGCACCRLDCDYCAESAELGQVPTMSEYFAATNNNENWGEFMFNNTASERAN